MIGYSVIETYEDEVPEPFGGYWAEREPNAGDIIQLKWLNGRDAYKVKVLRVDLDEFRLVVKKI